MNRAPSDANPFMIEKEGIPYHSCAREVVTLIAAVWRCPSPYLAPPLLCAAVSRHVNDVSGGNRLAANSGAMGRRARALPKSGGRARFRGWEPLSGDARCIDRLPAQG